MKRAIHPAAPLAAALVAVSAYACGPRTAASVTPADDVQVRAVRVAPVVRTEAAEPIRAAGLLLGKEESRLSFKVGGVVRQVLVDEGTRVTAGTLLATLQPDEIAGRVTQAHRVFEKAERDLDRLVRLHDMGIVATQNVDDARTQRDVARAALDVAQFDAQYASIHAPEDGIVLARLAEPAELVAPGTPVLRFKAASEGWVVQVGLPDRDVVRVQLGDTAVVASKAYPGRTFAGRVTQIAGAASPATGTFDVEVAVDPNGTTLYSGMYVAVDVQPSQREPVAIVPIDALLEGNGDRGTVLTLAADGKTARRVSVQVAFLDGDRVALRAGVDGVDEVITDGAAWVRDGAPVRVLPSALASGNP